MKYKGNGIGTYGDASCFSFHATKVFNTIEDPYASEGKVITFFNTDADRIKTMNGTAKIWYLRSAEVSYTNYFRSVSMQGNMNSYVPSTRVEGICPCISI